MIPVEDRCEIWGCTERTCNKEDLRYNWLDNKPKHSQLYDSADGAGSQDRGNPVNVMLVECVEM